MNNTLFSSFKKIPDAPLPPQTHEKIMRGIFLYRMQKIVTGAIIITSISFVFSLWHLSVRTTELDFISTAQSIISGLEFDIDSIATSLHTLLGFTPVTASIITFLNLIALMSSLYLLRTLKTYRMNS